MVIVKVVFRTVAEVGVMSKKATNCLHQNRGIFSDLYVLFRFVLEKRVLGWELKSVGISVVSSKIIKEPG